MENKRLQEILKLFPNEYEIFLADWSAKEYEEHPKFLSIWDISIDAKDKAIILGKRE